jgi:hypothetical protein
VLPWLLRDCSAASWTYTVRQQVKAMCCMHAALCLFIIASCNVPASCAAATAGGITPYYSLATGCCCVVLLTDHECPLLLGSFDILPGRL